MHNHHFILRLTVPVMAAALFFTGCHPAPRPPDVSRIPMQVRLERFDQDLFLMDTNQVQQGLAALYQKYPDFLPVYLDHILNYGPYSDTSIILRQEVRGFISSKDLRALQDTVALRFRDTKQLESQLKRGFQYIKYYCPSFKAPKVVTFISGLNNYGAITADSILGIGLDMFLGSRFPIYGLVPDPYPDYMLHQFSPEYIAVNCFKVIEQQLFPGSQNGKNLLEQMIAGGKQLYFLDQVMPGAPDSIKTGYTGKQTAWCKANEQYIWQYFVQNNLLYVTDWQQIMHFIGPGPSTQGMPPESPGDIGSWSGWQIVRKYMEKHPETSLQQLMEMKDAQQILADARYRPGG